MNELKIECGCGQHYTFEVEPLHGQMPFPVACPNCGADGTSQANLLLAQIPGLSAPPMAEAVAASAGLRLSGASSAATSAATVSDPPLPARFPVAPAASASSGAGPNYLLGTAGAMAAGLLAMTAWYWLIKLTGYEIGYAAWGIGVLVGFGARLLSKSGSVPLGVIAGACACVAVLGGQYLNLQSQANQFMEQAIKEAYQERMTYAQEAIQAQNDEQIKALLIKYEENASPTAQDISDFRNDEFPKLKEFAAGTPSKAQFEKSFKAFAHSSTYQWLLLKESVGLFTLLWLFLGVGTAFKIGSA